MLPYYYRSLKVAQKFTEIQVSSRAKAGKGAARATRRDGLVPAVIYGGKSEPTLIALDPRIVMRELSNSSWRSHLYQIKGDGVTSVALMRAVQLHPVTDRPLHVDFQRMVAGQHIRVEIPVVFEGEEVAPGIKRGGVLNAVMHSVEVNCDVDHIPEAFTADVAQLDIHGTIHWSDLKGTEHVTHTNHEEDFVIATIAPPTVSVETEETTEEETTETEVADKAASKE